MKLLPLVASLLIGFTPASAADWKPLFNGKDFTGWETYLAKPPATLTVPGLERDAKGEYAAALGVNRDPLHGFAMETVDGEPALHIRSEVPGGIATLESFENYHLRLEFKWGELKPGQKADNPRNSGVLYHAHGAHGDGNGRWLPSHQFQVQIGNCGEYVAMGDGAAVIRATKADAKRFVFDPAGEEHTVSNTAPDPTRCSGLRGEEKPVGEWNTLEIYCVGDEVLHVVNGKPVLRLKSRTRTERGDYVPLTKGRIELQAEGWDIYFRRVQVMPVNALPADPSH